MIHPIPPGTRDVLPDEMRELRALTDRLRDSVRRGRATARCGRRRSSTRTCCAAATTARPAPATGLFDEHGRRAGAALGHDDPDRPGGRATATRTREPPLRLCYFAHAYRAVDARRGQPREFLQGGLELIGVPGAEGDAEVIAL